MRAAMEADAEKQDRLPRADERRRKIAGDIATVNYRNDSQERLLAKLDREIHAQMIGSVAEGRRTAVVERSELELRELADVGEPACMASHARMHQHTRRVSARAQTRNQHTGCLLVGSAALGSKKTQRGA